jgi:hypothetical protein
MYNVHVFCVFVSTWMYVVIVRLIVLAMLTVLAVHHMVSSLSCTIAALPETAS